MGDFLINSQQRKLFLKQPELWLQENGISLARDQVAEKYSERNQVLDQLKELKGVAGVLSRSIGDAKKNGQSIDSLLVKMRSLKQRKDELQSLLKQYELHLISIVDSALACNVEASDSRLPKVEIEDGGLAANVPSRNQNEAFSSIDIVEYNAELSLILDGYIRASAESSVYHHPSYCDLLERVFGHKSLRLVALRGKEIVGFLPLVIINSKIFGHFAVSMPFFNYGGVLANTPEVARSLVAEAGRIAIDRGCDYIEYRSMKLLCDLPYKTNKVAMWLSLTDSTEALWKKLSSKVRAQIRKAQRHEFDLKIGGVELLDDFYHVFAINMRDLGTPVYSKSFFRAMLESSEGEKKLVVLKSQGRAVSASFLLGYAGRMEVPWASTLKKYNRYNANMLLYWHMLKFACDRGYDTFDFGRSSVDAATYRFKKQWGAEPKQLYWCYWLGDGVALPELNPNNSKYKLLISIWRRLPVWLTKWIGPPVVKDLA